MVQAQTPATDGDWKKHHVTLLNTPEADVMIRVGDIDNLNYGFAPGFDPFTGKSTPVHGYPWTPNTVDPAGTDRIMVPTSYVGAASCTGDGYSKLTKRPHNAPQEITIPLAALKGKTITSIYLQIFVDDFRSPSLKSYFKVWLNGKVRVPEFEQVLRGIDQGGPIGKLITIKLNTDKIPLFKQDKITLFIDDSLSCVGDGYAIDFVKVLVNTKKFNKTVSPQFKIVDAQTQQPLANVTVSLSNGSVVRTDANGMATFPPTPAGLCVVFASAKEYKSIRKDIDLVQGNTQVISLNMKPAPPVIYEETKLDLGTVVILKNVQFGQGKYTTDDAGIAELDRVVKLMNENPFMVIELAGHTSNEGEASLNKVLSEQRVLACKKYLVSRGIEEDRIVTIGYGGEKPLLPNTTVNNRIYNRRVEMKVVRM